MKIDRLQRLKGYRIFRDFSWPVGLPNFERYNLIYGWNGAGKTSLSTLFRCIQNRMAPDGIDVQIVVDGAVVKGTEFKAATLPPLRVFNRDFVDRNVFEKPGEELPPVYFLGEDSAEKQKKISQLKSEENEIRKSIISLETARKKASMDLNEFCTAQARSIRNLLYGDPRYNNYEAPKYREQISQLELLDSLPPQLPENDWSKYERAISAKPMPHVAVPVFGNLKLPSLTERVQAILTRTVVASSIPALVENPSLAAWVQQGLQLHKQGNGKCHFCAQALPPSRIADLEAHFNDQFKQLQADISQLLRDVDAMETAISSRQLPAKVMLYEHLHGDYDKAMSTFNQQSLLLCRYIEGLKRALVTKRDEPFVKMNTLSFVSGFDRNSEDTSTLIKVFEAIMTGLGTWGAQLGANALEQITKVIEAHNQYTDNFSAEAKMARTRLERDELIKSFDGWQIRQCALKEATAELNQVKERLKAITEGIGQLERQVRQHRKPAEELNVEMAAYLGRDELKFDVKDNGYTITRGGHPAMHLSDGERTAIAFMYFLKSLRDTGFDLKNGVVVIDDPVSSLDANSLYCAFGYMKEYTRDAAQLFILTHNFAFFRQVKNWFNAIGGFLNKPYSPTKSKDVHFYMLNGHITGAGRSARLETLDPLLHAYESEYHYLFRCVKDGAALVPPKSLAEVYGMPNVARRLLESFLAFRVPGKAGELRQQVELLNGDAAKKARVVRFLHTHSHAGHVSEPEHDLSMLSETPAILNDVLELVRLNDAPHYDAMLKIV